MLCVYDRKFPYKCFFSYNLQLMISVVPEVDIPCAHLCIHVVLFAAILSLWFCFRWRVMSFFFLLLCCSNFNECFSEIQFWSSLCPNTCPKELDYISPLLPCVTVAYCMSICPFHFKVIIYFCFLSCELFNECTTLFYEEKSQKPPVGLTAKILNKSWHNVCILQFIGFTKIMSQLTIDGFILFLLIRATM